MLTRDPPDLSQRIAPLLGQVQRIRATVGRAIPSLDEPALLELVEQRHEAAREHAEFFAERLLAEAVSLSEDPQNAHVRRFQVQRGQTLREPHGGVGSYLRQKESQLTCRLQGRVRGAQTGHSFLRKMVIDNND